MAIHAPVSPSFARAQRSFNGPFKRWPLAADAVLAGFMLVMTLVFASDPDPSGTLILRTPGELPLIAYLIAIVGCGALYWRRTAPTASYVVVVGASIAATAVESPEAFFFIVAVYALGRYVTDDRLSAAGIVAALAFAGTSSLITEERTQDIVGGIIFVFVVWYIGRRIRVRRTYLAVLQEHAARLEQQREVEASRAVADERSRIARELHDVVAHKVSLMTVQAGAAKTVAMSDPDSATAAMEAVEQAGRQALDELRHLLGVLRPDARPDTLGPQSGLADVPALVDQFRTAGLDVSLDMDGAPPDLPARMELSMYRIIQEALTNVLKHGGPDAQVTIHIGPGVDNTLIVTIEDRGVGSTILEGAGHGIMGMRERATLLGGTLEAGPRSGGGFQVTATLPIIGAPT